VNGTVHNGVDQTIDNVYVMIQLRRYKITVEPDREG
jgi:hypothetical protein